MNLSSHKHGAPTTPGSTGSHTFTPSLGAQPSPFLCTDLAISEFNLASPGSITGRYSNPAGAFFLLLMIWWTCTISAISLPSLFHPLDRSHSLPLISLVVLSVLFQYCYPHRNIRKSLQMKKQAQLWTTAQSLRSKQTSHTPHAEGQTRAWLLTLSPACPGSYVTLQQSTAMGSFALCPHPWDAHHQLGPCPTRQPHQARCHCRRTGG